jgi:hypothetical protein
LLRRIRTTLLGRRFAGAEVDDVAIDDLSASG